MIFILVHYTTSNSSLPIDDIISCFRHIGMIIYSKIACESIREKNQCFCFILIKSLSQLDQILVFKRSDNSGYQMGSITSETTLQFNTFTMNGRTLTFLIPSSLNYWIIPIWNKYVFNQIGIRNVKVLTSNPHTFKAVNHFGKKYGKFQIVGKNYKMFTIKMSGFEKQTRL